jgi:hypothetical protein
MWPAIWIIQVFRKMPRHYANCRLILGKVQNIVLYVILLYDFYNYYILLLILQTKCNFYLLLYYYYYINILLKLIFNYYNML